MEATTAKPKTIDEFIAAFPQETQESLQKIRGIIKKTAPEAEETISYGVPTFKLNGTYMIYFSGYKNHIGIYPIPNGTDDFLKKIEPYKAGKGTLQFQLKKPIPWDLVTEIAENSLRTNLARTSGKKKEKTKTAKT